MSTAHEHAAHDHAAHDHAALAAAVAPEDRARLGRRAQGRTRKPKPILSSTFIWRNSA